MTDRQQILWIDDEIELLRSHILFLTEKGYEVDTVTNGEDAIYKVREKHYDLIFIDEMMPGMGGLETLSEIKEINPAIPIVMVTKNEEESLMNDAIGNKIDDYLIKPVLPSQMLMVCKKILDKKKISGEYVTKDYMKEFSRISARLMGENDFLDWIDIYKRLTAWDLELDEHPEIDLRQTLYDQIKEANKEFSKYVERNYYDWIIEPDDAPTLSPQIFERYVLPELTEAEGPVFFFVLDCMRLDQWRVMEKYLREYFNIVTDYYYSILPTATPYSRNALFSGLFPAEIQQRHPEYWVNKFENESQLNKHEKDLLSLMLRRYKVDLRNEMKYLKIIDPAVGRSFAQNVASHKNTHFMAVVINFLDMIVHSRSDNDVLKEISPDEPAFRSLTESWFKHSSFFSIMKTISGMKGARVILTTDHGSIRVKRGAKVLGDKEAAKNLRFKYGRNLKADDKHAMYIRQPEKFKLPEMGIATNYIIAKEDYYFVYPTDYHKYLNLYRDTFQHGGISMEEMILPVALLEAE
jgi:CheY-like chemotaxis protein